MEPSRAYAMGRQAAARGGKITAPEFGRIHSARYAEMLEEHFWQGVRDIRAEDRLNADAEWD
jgi:hypothetical protein